MIVYCAGPHVEPVPLYTVQVPAEVTKPAPHRALCSDCATVYAEAVAAPAVLVDQVDSAGAPTANPDHLSRGVVPPLPLVTRHKRRRIPDWTPVRDNYGPPAGVKSR